MTSDPDKTLILPGVKQGGDEIILPTSAIDALQEELAEPEWQEHHDENGTLYFTHENYTDKYGRLVRFRSRGATVNSRAQRRAAGIRTPLAVLEAYEASVAEMVREVLAELGTRDDTLGSDSDGT